MDVSLTEERIDAIHRRSLELLADVGMAVKHEEMRTLLADAGATVDGETVTVAPSLVEECVETALSTFRWHARNPDRSVTVGAGEPVVAPADGARYVVRPGGERRRATMDDFETMAKLAHGADAITCVGYDLVSPEPYSLPADPGGYDEPPVAYDLLASLVRHTDKPLVGSTRGTAHARASLDVAGIAHGDRRLRKPYVLGLVHARSPRLWNEALVDGLLAYARAGQPVIVSASAMAGATAPVGLPETLVLANAEALFGIVMTQIVTPGTPVVYGHACTDYDHESGTFVHGNPTAVAFAPVVAALADRYGVPSRGDGGLTDAKALDDQAGSESMLRVAETMRAGIDVVCNAAGFLDTEATVSPEKFVLDCERLRFCRHVARERSVLAEADIDDASMARLREIDPGETVADDREPAATAAAAHYTGGVGPRRRYERWLSAGGESLAERARGRVTRRLDAYDRPAIDSAVDEALRAYVRRHRE